MHGTHHDGVAGRGVVLMLLFLPRWDANGDCAGPIGLCQRRDDE